MRVQLERGGGTYKVAVRGNVADARPFIRSLDLARLGQGSQGDEGFPRRRPRRLAQHPDRLQRRGDHGRRSSRRPSGTRRSEAARQFSGKLAPAPVTAQTRALDRGAPVMVLQADDAGATVALPRHLSPDAWRGALRPDDDRRRPAIRRRGHRRLHAAQRTGAQADRFRRRSRGREPRTARRACRCPLRRERGRVHARRGSSSAGRRAGSSFRTARSAARRSASRSAASSTTRRDRTDISGTFVPAYGLNNAFAQVPLFGPLLGGGQYEGLFAVNFRDFRAGDRAGADGQPALGGRARLPAQAVRGRRPARWTATGATLLPPARTER